MKIIRIERIKNPNEGKKSVAWLIGITDLTTLLLAFFIMMVATATPREKPWLEASESMRTRFGGSEHITQMTGEAGSENSEKTWLSVEQDPGLDLTYLFSIVKKQLQQEPALTGISVWKEMDNVVISFPADLTFAPGSDQLSSQGNRIVSVLTPFLSKLPNSVEVIGYADPTMVNTDGRFGSNWHLSLARAASVAHALRQAGYQPPVAIRGRGTMDFDLLPKNLPDAARNAKARRVDLRLYLQQP